MPNKREYDYEKLAKCLAENNLFSEHFSDLRGIEHGDYLKIIESSLEVLQELLQKQYKNNGLIREVEEHILLDHMVSNEQIIFKESSKELETKIAMLDTSILELTLDYIRKIMDISDKFTHLEEIYNLENIKSELLKVQHDKEETQKVIVVNIKILDNLMKKFDLMHTDMPNLKDIFDESFENEKIKKYGDLSGNQKRLSDISQSYKELSKKIQNLKQ